MNLKIKSVRMQLIDPSIRVVTTVEYSYRFRITVIDEIEPLYTRRGVSMRHWARQLDAGVLLADDSNGLDHPVTP